MVKAANLFQFRSCVLVSILLCIYIYICVYMCVHITTSFWQSLVCKAWMGFQGVNVKRKGDTKQDNLVIYLFSKVRTVATSPPAYYSHTNSDSILLHHSVAELRSPYSNFLSSFCITLWRNLSRFWWCEWNSSFIIILRKFSYTAALLFCLQTSLTSCRGAALSGLNVYACVIASSAL